MAEKSSNSPEGRCMKCKKQVTIKDPQEIVWKNGMKVASGSCPTCGTGVNRILGKADSGKADKKTDKKE